MALAQAAGPLASQALQTSTPQPQDNFNDPSWSSHIAFPLSQLLVCVFVECGNLQIYFLNFSKLKYIYIYIYINIVLFCLDIYLCYQSEIFTTPFYPKNHGGSVASLVPGKQSPCWQGWAGIRELYQHLLPLKFEWMR